MYSSSGKKLVGFQRGTSHSHIYTYIYWWFFLGAFVYYSFLVGSTGCDLLTPPVETAGVAQHAKDWTKQHPSLSFSLSLFFLLLWFPFISPFFFFFFVRLHLFYHHVQQWKGKEEGSFWHLSRLFVRLCLYAFPPGIAYSYRYIYIFFPFI